MTSSREYQVGDLVRSLTGRDRLKYYLVWSVGDSRLELVDGQTRRIENPKRKNPKHVGFLGRNAEELARKLAAGTGPSNLEVRKTIAELVSSLGEDQE
ncbi:MAG: KOW domain-containing RNA-binding protein [Syntrophomonadaceae bacterium]|nr:KOW domain-containing RNA-binding protein [Syntrophomonadaceae bacterium]